MSLKDLRVRGLVAAGALLVAAACGGDTETEAAAPAAPAAPAPAADSAGAPATLAPPPAATAQPPVAPGASPAAPRLGDAVAPPAAPEAGVAPPSGPVTVQSLNSYTLSMPRLRSLVQAGQNIVALQAQRPGLADSMRIPTMDPNLLYHKLNGIPAVRDAVRRAGMSPEEYAIATAALLQASVVYEMRRSGQTPPPNFNQANAVFVAEHWSEIQTLMRGAGRPPSGPRQN